MRNLLRFVGWVAFFGLFGPVIVSFLPVVLVLGSPILAPLIGIGLARLIARIFSVLAQDVRTILDWVRPDWYDRFWRRRENGEPVLLLGSLWFNIRAILRWFVPRVELPPLTADEWMHTHGGWRVNAAEDQATGHFILPDGTRARGKIQRLGSSFRCFFIGAAPFTNHCLRPVVGTSDWFIHPANGSPTSFEAAVRGVEGWVRIVWPGRRSSTA